MERTEMSREFHVDGAAWAKPIHSGIYVSQCSAALTTATNCADE